MKIAIVFNPVGDDVSVQAVRRAVSARSLDVDWIETTEDDPGRGQAERAASDGCGLVIAVGGDGTVRACAEGLAATGSTLGIVPAGTGNLLARNLDIPTDPDQALRVCFEGRMATLDTGSVNGETFAVIAGAGIDAVIMSETDRGTKDRLGALAYVLEGAKHVFDQPFAARLSVDGSAPVDGKWATVMVGNLGRLQGGVDLLPDSRPHDGLIDVLALSASSPVQNLAAALEAVTGGGDRILRAQARAVDVWFDAAIPYQLDGEARPPADHLAFSVQPRSLSVMTPRSEA